MNVATIIAGLLMLTGVNAYRAEHHVPALSWSADTCILAMQRVVDIQSEWSHRLFFKRVGLIPADGWWYEALGRYHGESDWRGMLQDFKDSPTHNQILLSDATAGCIAYENGYWALEFSRYDR